MANECDGHAKAQIGILARFLTVKQRLPEMYETKIGQLRDEFDINIPKEIEDSHLWSQGAKDFLLTSCTVIVGILDKERVKPKPYEPGKLEDINEVVNEMEKRLFDEVLVGVTECVCARAPDICEQYEEPVFETPLIHEETPIG